MKLRQRNQLSELELRELMVFVFVGQVSQHLFFWVVLVFFVVFLGVDGRNGKKKGGTNKMSKITKEKNVIRGPL